MITSKMLAWMILTIIFTKFQDVFIFFRRRFTCLFLRSGRKDNWTGPPFAEHGPADLAGVAPIEEAAVRRLGERRHHHVQRGWEGGGGGEEPAPFAGVPPRVELPGQPSRIGRHRESFPNDYHTVKPLHTVTSETRIDCTLTRDARCTER